MRYIGDGRTLDREQSAALSRRLAEHWDRFGFGQWAAEEKSTGEVIGFVGLSHPLWFPGLEGAVEVGWRLARAAWGRGLATEGAREALRVASADLGLTDVISLIHPENGASLAVARKLGLEPRAERTHPVQGNLLLELGRRLA